MTHEQHLALDLIARLANRFGPASRIAKELPGWLEYLTEVECPERPRTRPSTQWWNKVRAIARDLVPAAGRRGRDRAANAALFGEHFGLSPVETSMLTFVAPLQVVRRVRTCRRWGAGNQRGHGPAAFVVVLRGA